MRLTAGRGVALVVEGAVAVAEEDAYGARSLLGDDQVRVPVTVEVTRGQGTRGLADIQGARGPEAAVPVVQQDTDLRSPKSVVARSRLPSPSKSATAVWYGRVPTA